MSHSIYAPIDKICVPIYLYQCILVPRYTYIFSHHKAIKQIPLTMQMLALVLLISGFLAWITTEVSWGVQGTALSLHTHTQVCVCERERERGRERERKGKRERERERESACAFVCVCVSPSLSLSLSSPLSVSLSLSLSSFSLPPPVSPLSLLSLPLPARPPNFAAALARECLAGDVWVFVFSSPQYFFILYFHRSGSRVLQLVWVLLLFFCFLFSQYLFILYFRRSGSRVSC